MQICRLFVACIIASTVIGLPGEEMGFRTPEERRILTIDDEAQHSFLGHFLDTFGDIAPEIIFDRVHPLSMARLTIFEEDHDRLMEKMDSRVRSGVTKSLQYSGRTIFADMALKTWLENRQGAIANFLRGSLGSISQFREEELQPTDLGYNDIERSWWSELKESGSLRYGVRPFRTSPYAYVGFRVRSGDETLFLSTLRIRYKDMNEPSVELALSIPVGDSCALDIGLSHKFTSAREGEDGKAVVRLVKNFRLASLYASANVASRPGLFLGIYRPW